MHKPSRTYRDPPHNLNLMIFSVVLAIIIWVWVKHERALENVPPPPIIQPSDKR